MVLVVRKAAERGYFDYGWLKTRHSFSFARYYDPRFTGFHSLKFLNEDVVQPQSGFPAHAHKNMEILSLILKGCLQHQDNQGNGSVIHAGEVQLMGAGSGIVHSEFNPSSSESVQFIQMGITAEAQGLPPCYQQRTIPSNLVLNRWFFLASRDGRESSMIIRQDVHLYLTRLNATKSIARPLFPDRVGYIHIVEGAIVLNGVALQSGDGAMLSQLPSFEIRAEEESCVLFLDLI